MYNFMYDSKSATSYKLPHSLFLSFPSLHLLLIHQRPNAVSYLPANLQNFLEPNLNTFLPSHDPPKDEGTHMTTYSLP